MNYNFKNNYILSILLSEHFNIYKKNPLMSYSILQTLLHYNYKNLSKEELIYIYDLMNQYIICAFTEKIKKIEIAKEYRETEYLTKIIKEMELKQYFHLIIKIKKTIKCMIYYSTKFINIIRHKEKYERSTIVKIDEIYNEIKYISSPYLSRTLLKELIDFLSIEIMYTRDIEKYLYDLEEYNIRLPCEFIYKILLFVDYFWNRKIPDKLLDIFYGFTSDSNLYTNEIKPEIYQILEKRYFDIFNEIQSKYYILFKYTKGAKIS